MSPLSTGRVDAKENETQEPEAEGPQGCHTPGLQQGVKTDKKDGKKGEMSRECHLKCQEREIPNSRRYVYLGLGDKSSFAEGAPLHYHCALRTSLKTMSSKGTHL